MKVYKQKIIMVEGSTIIETIVAMTILLSILSLFYTQYVKVDSSANPYMIYKAFEISNQVLTSNDLLFDKQYNLTIDGYKVKKVITLSSNGLFRVELYIYNQKEREIFKRTKWISNRIEL